MAIKQSKTTGLFRTRTLDAKTVNQMVERGEKIQKLVRLSRLGSAMEPLESRTLMSSGTLPILPAPFVSSAVSAPATTPTVQAAPPALQAAAKKPAKASAKAAVKTVPLSAPTALAAKGLSKSQIRLSWTDNSKGATGYDVLRSTDGIHFSQIARVTGAAADSFTNTGLSSGHTYVYEVQAVAGSTTSPTSAIATGVTQLVAPSGLSARATATSPMHIAWTNNDPSATGYLLLRSTNGSSFGLLTEVSGGTNSFDDNTVASFTKYYYKVEATNAVGTSPLSKTASGTTALVAPAGLTVSAINPTSAIISWTSQNLAAKSYSILRSTGGSGFTQVHTITAGHPQSWTDTTLSSDTTYTYVVKAVDGRTISPPSSTVTITTPLKAPTALTAALGSSGVVLHWTDNDPSATGYAVARSSDGVNFTTLFAVSGGSTTSCTDTTAASGGTYTYEVTATAGNVTSAVSNTATVAVNIPVAAPTALTAVTSGAAVVLNWTDNDPSATGCNILRSSDGTTFTQIAQLSSGTATTFTDTSDSTGSEYYYQVQAIRGSMTSVSSNTASVATPLAAPTGLSADGSTGSVVLIWTDQDSAATGYTILRSTDGATFTAIAQITGGTVASFTDSTIGSSNTFYYQVQAFNAVSTSSPSAVAQVIMPVLAPTGLTATPSGSSIVLNWTDNDPSATGYSVLRSADGTTFAPIAQLSSGGSDTYTDQGVPTGSKYFYQVLAINGLLKSAPSNTITIVTVLAEPIGLTVSGSTGSAVLTWTDQDGGATGYNILRSTNGTTFTQIAQATGGTATTFTDSTVSPSHTYYYEVQAFNAVSTSSPSGSAPVTMPVAAPTGLAASFSGGAVVLHWTDNDPLATGYSVLRSSNGTTFAQIAQLSSGSAATYTDSTVSAGSEYYYQVQAVNGSMTSASSNTATVVTTLAAPTGLSASGSTGSAVLIWTDQASAATGYNILRSTNGTSFTTIAQVTGGTAATYTDSTVSLSQTYYYEVEAFDTVATSSPSAAATVRMSVNAPSGLSAALSGSSVVLNWTDNDPLATGYSVLRSSNGTTFAQIAQLSSGSAAAYTDATVSAGSEYYYQVKAFNGVLTSVSSNTASVVTTLAAPTGLSASGSTGSAVLIWTDQASAATGYDILRSTNGTSFTNIAQVTGGTATTYTDSTVSLSNTYYYEVEAFDSVATSSPSAASTVRMSVNTPSGLSAALSGSAVVLNWTDNDSLATGYDVLRSSNGTTFTQIAQLSSGSAATYTDTTATAGSEYYYQVQAVNGVLTSISSNTATVITPLAAPSGLSANGSTGSAVLTWTDNGSSATGYNILRSTNGTTFTTIAQVTGGTATTCTDSTVSPSQTYYYEVQAINTVSSSAPSASAQVIMPVGAPKGLTATTSGGSVVLNWTDTDSLATGYNVLRSSNGTTFTQIAQLSSGSAATYTDSTVSTGSEYYYQVQAVNGSLTSVSSNTASVVTTLGAPGGLGVSGSTGSAVLTWTDHDSSATGYDILRSTNGTSFTNIAQVTGGTATTYTDSTVSLSNTYYYEVEAFDAVATSPASAAASVRMSVVAPTALTAALSGGSVVLNWTDNDPLATGYNVLRSSNGTTFTQIAQLSSGSAATYTDSSVSTGTEYYYQVQAVNGVLASASSNTASVITPLAAPSGLSVSGSTGSAVLTWTDNGSSATGYNILRSTNGTSFSAIAQLTSGAATTYTDSTVSSSHTYYYEVQAYDAVTTSPASAAASVTMPVLAPSGLTASAGSSSITLSWMDNDPFGTGYNVLRSTNGTTFTTLTTLSQATANSYVDSSVTAGQQYYYQVQAVSGSLTSAVSNTATATVPTSGPSTVTIATRYSDELVITLTGASDTVSVSQSGSTLTIVADGQTSTQSVPAAGTFIYTRGGTDSIQVASSVSAQTTIETIDTAVDTISSSGSHVTVWDDSSDIFTGAASVHTVSAFADGVSKAAGASLPNPSDSGSVMTVSASLWGTGPVVADVNQGDSGDCYVLASLAAFASVNPTHLEQSVVDMGDGTYTVEFYSGGSPEFARVSDQLPSSGGGYVYARPGSDGNIWAPIIEKAYCYFRTGANTYASISSGWMGDVYTALGVSNTYYYTSSVTTDSALYSQLSADLAAGKAVTMGTFSSTPQLVSSHAYTLMSVAVVGGVNEYTVRNPWGFSGDSLENSQGYATVTYAQFEANFQDVCVAT